MNCFVSRTSLPCQLGCLRPQVQLYEDFAKSRAKASVDESISTASAEEEEKPKLKATGHVFQVCLSSTRLDVFPTTE